MKKVYDYNTKRLTESYALDNKAQSLNESNFDINDITMNARELHNDAELKNVIVAALKKAANGVAPIVLWSNSGNGIFNSVENCCDELNDATNGEVNYLSISGRDLENADAEDFDATIAIINDYTIADPMIAANLVYDLYNNGILVICLCRLDSTRAEEHMEADVFDNAVHYLYSPMYDRQSNFIDDDDDMYESVTEKFARYRKLYESDEEKSEESGDPFADMFADDNAGSEEDKDKEEDKGEEGEEKDSEAEDKEGEDEDEYVPMTAIIITVAKDDADKCKDEMVEAGISEDGIEILEGEEDDENAKIRVDADYAKELKDYLSGKGIDLEEKIGGEIVDDTEEEGEEKEDDKEKEGEDKEEGDDEEIDFDTEFGDLFGDDEESSDEEK